MFLSLKKSVFKIKHFYDLLELSPIQLSEDESKDIYMLLDNLYDDNDYICIGDIYSDTIKKKFEWIKDSNLVQNQFFCINKLSGEGCLCNENKTHFKCIKTVDYKYVLCEIDSEIGMQLEFWYTAVEKLPVSAVIFSGKNSIQAILYINCKNVIEWNKIVNNLLYEKLKKYNIRITCCNPLKFARLPGFLRTDTNKKQKLIYLRKF